MTDQLTETEFTRLPPHDLGAERWCLGGMLMSARVRNDVADRNLKPGDHYLPAHQIIHEAILRVEASGHPVDAVTVYDDIGQRGLLGRLPDRAYLHTLIADLPLDVQAGYYAGIIAGHAIRRRMIEKGTQIAQLGYEGTGDAAELAEHARALADDIPAQETGRGPASMDELFLRVVQQLESKTQRGLPYPWHDVNRVTQGLKAGELCVVAAATSFGKSVAGLQIAATAAIDHGIPSVIFSAEMTDEEIMLRLISARGRIPFDVLMSHSLTARDWDRLSAIQSQITAAPLLVEDNPACSLGEIRRTLRTMKRRSPAGLAVVDYLQLMQAPERAENRQVAVGGLARGLKLIAGEFGIPVVAISQVNRAPSHRQDKTPHLSDLRESGDIENHASTVILIHRDDMYEQESPRAGEADLIIAKNRNGPRCTVTVAFQGHYQRFMGMAPEDDGPDGAWSASRHATDTEAAA